MDIRRAIAVLIIVLTCGGASQPGVAATSKSPSRLIPPPDGQTYFGFTVRTWDTQDPAWGDSRPFAERMGDSIRSELASKTPTLLTVWAGWQAPDVSGKPLIPFSERMDDVRKVETIVGAKGFVALDWTLSTTSATNGGITTKDVASGSLDDYIRRCARELKDYGRPVLVRLFGGEMNGSWWYGVSPRANPSLSTANFVAAWRRVVDMFRAAGAANVSWAWVPNAIPPEPVPWVDPDLGAYYPGDDYVDWAGGDAYDVGPPSWLDRLHAFAVAHDKPFFLAEWGVRHEGSVLAPAQQRDWLDAMFDYIEARPAIKAISYFNYNNRLSGQKKIDPARLVFLYGGSVNYQANVNDHDHRLLADSEAGFRTTFARRIASPRYVSTATTGQLEAEAAVAVVVSVVARHGSATIRWRGNAASRSYDLGIRRGTGAWRIVVSRLGASSYRIRGKPGTVASVRVRARDASGIAGTWSAPRTFRFK